MKCCFYSVLALIVLISSTWKLQVNVYAAEAGTEESSEATNLFTDSNLYGTLLEIFDGSKDRLQVMADDLQLKADFLESVAVDFCGTSADIADQCYQFASDSLNQSADIWNRIKVFFDGENVGYSVEPDFQQAVYNALMQFTATQNGGIYFKPMQAASPVFVDASYTWGYYNSKLSRNYVLTEQPVWWYYIPADQYGPSTASAIKDCDRTEPNAFTPSGYFRNGTFSSTSATYCFTMGSDIENNSTSWGPALIAFYSYSDYKASVSASAPAYINTTWQPSGVVYITNDGLNYDWAAYNSNLYSTIVQGIQDGTVSGQIAINENMLVLSEQLNDIRQTIEQTSEDVAGIEALLQKYLPFLESINSLLSEKLPLLDEIADSPAVVVELTDHLNVLKDIKTTVNSILALMFLEDVTDVVNDFFEDDQEEKDDYLEKSIGYVLLVLLLFVYIIRIFIHLLAFIVAFFNIEPALCSDFLPYEVYQGFQFLDELIIPYFNVSVWDFLQVILFTTMIFYLIRVFINRMDHFKFND